GIAAPAVDLHQAQAARAEGLQTVGGAQLGNIDAGLGRGAHDRSAFGHRDLLAVDGEGDELFGNAGRRAQVAVALDDGFEHGGSRSGQAGCAAAGAATPKSSGKWFNADSTGYGVMPPSAHSDPPSMVSHRSRSRCTCCSCWAPRAAILSSVSTPRTAPMRQGVHLPQDSTAQNSMA